MIHPLIILDKPLIRDTGIGLSYIYEEITKV